MFKSLLLAIDHSEYSYVTTRYAIEWARILDAHVTILSVLDKKELAIVYPFIFPQDEIALDYDPQRLGNELLERQAKQAQEAISKAVQACQDANVQYTIQTAEGIVAKEILASARDTDMLFIGQRGHGAEHSTGLLGSNLESVVRQAHRPVLITPNTYRPVDSVLVAYDGGTSASEALHCAVAIYSAWAVPSKEKRFTVLIVDNDPESAKKIEERVLGYVSAYELEPDIRHAEGDPAAQILCHAEETDADLLAMGAYGRTRVYEMILGSTTEQVLRKIDRPLLLIH